MRSVCCCKKFLITLTLLSPLLFISRALSQIYDLKDLEVLEKQGNYREFLSHALDIRPSQRTALWDKMTQDMAVGRIKELMSNGEVGLNHFTEIEKLALWPILKKDDYFQLKRNDFFLSFLANCFQKTPQECSVQRDHFWPRATQNIDLASDILRITPIGAKNARSRPQLEYIFADKLAAAFCQKDHIQQWAFEMITQELSTQSDAHIQSFALKRINKDCAQAIGPFLKQKLLSDVGAKSSSALAIFLKETGELKGLELEVYYVTYLLQSPQKGDVMNWAWNFLQGLAENLPKRVELLDAINKFDPLPGQIFKDADKNKRKVIMKAFATNFPEYLREFGQTCLNYLRGLGHYPRGNPTIECPQFMQAVEAYHLLPPQINHQYQAIQNKYK